MNSWSREFIIPGTAATLGLIILVMAILGFGAPQKSAPEIATRAASVNLGDNILRLIGHDRIRKGRGPRLHGNAARQRISGA